MQSILQRRGNMSTKDEQCHADSIPCNRGWRFYFTPQPRIKLSLFQGKLRNTNSLQLSLSTTMIFEHHIVSNWLILSDALPIKGFLKACWRLLDKLFKLDWRSFFFLMWLNLVRSTKLPTYPGEGSSHYVVQPNKFFSFWWFFLWFWWFFFLCFCFFFFFTKREGSRV